MQHPSANIDPQYLQSALAAAFNAAKPAHGLKSAIWQRYVGYVVGFHAAEFVDGGQVYRALFDQDLALDFINLEHNPAVCWNRHEQTWTTATAD